MAGGRLYVIDGPDGAGKTTQAARVAACLRERGREVLVLREPGGTPVGEAIRDVLLDPDTDLTATAEMVLYQAARAQLVEAVVRPALEAGTDVVLDRFTYSTVAYQAFGLGLDADAVRQVAEVVTGGLRPQRVFILDLDPETGLERLQGDRDRIEGRPLDFHRRVREGFLAEAERLGEDAVVVDATRSVDDVTQAILSHVEP